MKKRTFVLPTLVALSLIGCTDQKEELTPDSRVRAGYTSEADCRKEWNAEDACRRDQTSGHFMSPWMQYYMYSRMFSSGSYHGAAGVYSESTSSFHSTSSVSAGGGKVSISRGGFGGTSHGSSMGS
jgi:hypothetical protein